jgi:hypothetical protein
MSTTQPKHLVGVFTSRAQAERAVHDLRGAGFSEDQIALVMHHDDSTAVTDLDAALAAKVTGQSKTAEGAVAGVAAGAVLGGLMALVPAIIPGLGPVLTVGTLAAALFGAAAGGAGGGIVGALIGADFPEEEARLYEHALKSGHILVGVKAGDRWAEAQDILQLAGALDLPGETAERSEDLSARAGELRDRP